MDAVGAGSVAAAVSVTVNGVAERRVVEARVTLADFLRDELGLTGTKLGCEHGVCGACTVVVDGRAARSCLMLAVQADGAEVRTVEGLSDGRSLNRLQEAFRRHHALQCGFCTAGMLMTATAVLDAGGRPSREDIRDALSGNLCRCTGYEPCVDAIEAVAASSREG